MNSQIDKFRKFLDSKLSSNKPNDSTFSNTPPTTTTSNNSNNNNNQATSSSGAAAAAAFAHAANYSTSSSNLK